MEKQAYLVAYGETGDSLVLKVLRFWELGYRPVGGGWYDPCHGRNCQAMVLKSETEFVKINLNVDNLEELLREIMPPVQTLVPRPHPVYDTVVIKERDPGAGKGS